MTRRLRQFALFLVPMLLVGGALAVLAVPALGQAGNSTATNSTAPSGNATGSGSIPKIGLAEGRVFVISAQEDSGKCPDGKAPCWDVPLFVVNPGDKVTVNVDLTKAGVPHNWDMPKFPGGAVKAGGSGSQGDIFQASFTFPADATTIDYQCDLHSASMVGKIGIASALSAPAAEGSNVPELGVHFLSYWVGLIAFMLLFIVYGATFFLFKYNETSATTDQWERAGAGAPEFQRRFSPGMASILAIVLAAVLIAVVIFLARR